MTPRNRITQALADLWPADDMGASVDAVAARVQHATERYLREELAARDRELARLSAAWRVSEYGRADAEWIAALFGLAWMGSTFALLIVCALWPTVTETALGMMLLGGTIALAWTLERFGRRHPSPERPERPTTEREC